MKKNDFQYVNFKNDWKKAWYNNAFKIQCAFTLFVLIALAVFINDFFSYVEQRSGSIINDYLLNIIPPKNVSFYIFLLIYSFILLSIVNLFWYPELFLKGLQAYCFLTILRIISIYLFPLEPPSLMVILKDPFVDHFFYNNINITKDLFFSGHIGTLFLLFLLNPVKKLNVVYLAGIILTAVLISIQHAHYTIDVIAAPIFVWICFKLALLIPLHSK